MAQPLSFVDSSYKEPSASAGSDLQIQNDLVLRPRIGGFYPSVMQGVVDGGRYLAPLAALTGRRMFSAKKRGGGKANNWTRNRERAKVELLRYGKPSAVNVNKYAAFVRKNSRAAAEFLRDYEARKSKKNKAKPSNRANPRGQVFMKKEAEENSKAAMNEYKKLMTRRNAPKVTWNNEKKNRFSPYRNKAVATLKALKEKHPELKRRPGNFMTLGKLMRDGNVDKQREFLRTYGVPLSDEAAVEPAAAPAAAAATKKNRFSPYRTKAAATLKALKEKHPDLKRRPGNFMTLGKLMRNGNVDKQREFLRTYGVPLSNEAAANAAAEATAAPPVRAETKAKYTRQEYWNAYRKANANLKTQGLNPRAENKRKLLESRRLGLNNADFFRTLAAAKTPVTETRKKSPIRAENIEAATGYLLSLVPQGAKGPSAVQARQYASMVKTGRENSMEEFIRNYVAKKTKATAK